MNPEEQLQDRLSRLENGESLESCTADLPAAEVELLEVVTALQSLVYPAQMAESIAVQRATLLKAAAEQRGAPLLRVRTPLLPRGRWNMLTPWPILARAAVLGVAIIVIIVGLLLLRPVATITPGVPAVQNAVLHPTAERYSQFIPLVSSAPVAANDPGSAVVTEVRGLVELQASGGQWKPISTGQALSAGQHVRTQALSSAALLFYDGSRTQLGPMTEVAIEGLNAQTSGPRTILLAQLSGSTDHDVAPSSDPASRYEVSTPNGTGVAKGTIFHVFISPARVTRIAVDEGTVVVINVDVTVQVTAGQVTTIGTGTPPTPPAFRVTGEGIVTQVGEVWRIGGLDFHTTNTTVIVGNPQLGDRVSVDGHLASDGTRIADVIVLLSRAPQNRFEFTGPVEAIGSDRWTIGGFTVAVSQTTHIDTGIQVGDLVKTDGVIRPDGTLLAENIRLLAQTDLPFEFTGLVQQIGTTAWTISGLTIAITDTTQIEAGLQVGSLVKVEGHILPNGTWLADEIKRASEFENRFEFSGIVQSMDPWSVSGLTFTTVEDTAIDAGIKIGDRVKVEGRVLAEGTWLAEEIQLLSDQTLTFEFIGQVTSLNPWIVSGISFTVNSSTTIDSNIEVGDLVRVSGIVQPDGTLLAERIELLDNDLGCMDVFTVIIRVDGNRIVLGNGQTIVLTDQIDVVGDLRASAVVIVRICVRADGSSAVISIIIIVQPQPPVPPPPLQACVGLVVVTNGQITLPNGTLVRLDNGTWFELNIKRKGDEVESRLNGKDPKVKISVKMKGGHHGVEVKLEGKGKDRLTVVGAGKYGLIGTLVIQACSTPAGPIIIVSGSLVPPPPPPPPPDSGKVTICHYPGGDKHKGHTLSVGTAAVSAHLAHGDTLGPCDGGGSNNNQGKHD